MSWFMYFQLAKPDSRNSLGLIKAWQIYWRWELYGESFLKQDLSYIYAVQYIPYKASKCISYPRIISWFYKLNVDITIMKKVVQIDNCVGHTEKAKVVAVLSHFDQK